MSDNVLPFKKPRAAANGTVLIHSIDVVPLAAGAVLLGAVITKHDPPAVLVVQGRLHSEAIVITITGRVDLDVVVDQPMLSLIEPLTLQASVSDKILVSVR